MDAHNTFDEPDAVTARLQRRLAHGGVLSLTLPAKSVVVLTLQ